ncbi:hypothetical protein BaRGS_00015822 [Batillaria attramentaria]|uniref:Uncharacterized protein n=1 Tax=Batillaria attramentaria TaxID=370345 RepID=A0ABD0L069_9CAEN
MAAARRVPVVVILGATGTGKSKLAIELGRHFGGEIISADSMQMYQGLDVITNKVTQDEQSQCPHHLLNVLHPLSTNNTVTNFRDMALPIVSLTYHWVHQVERLLNENKMPIIVGGTNYYIESLLWNFLIDHQTVELTHKTAATENFSQGEETSNKSTANATLGEKSDSCVSTTPCSEHQQVHPEHKPQQEHLQQLGNDSENLVSSGSSDEEPEEEGVARTNPQESSKAKKEKEGHYADFDSLHLHSLLQKVDPESAKRFHPKNRRKVVRALQVFDKYGVPMSAIHNAQHASGRTPGLSGGLRYPNSCVLWLRSGQTVLDERLDKRVEQMLEHGLVLELHELHTQYLDSVAVRDGKPDYTLGIFQSIGFKEFHEYLIMSPEERETPQGKGILEKGVEALKLATRQYARRQLKWIRNRFLNRAGPHAPDVYGLDSTDPSQWTEHVLDPAIEIVSAALRGEKPAIQPLSPERNSTIHVHNVCHVCEGRVFVNLKDWTAHLSSRRHKKMAQRKRHKEKAEACEVNARCTEPAS